jgi:DNA-binding protein H-NS
LDYLPEILGFIKKQASLYRYREACCKKSIAKRSTVNQQPLKHQQGLTRSQKPMPYQTATKPPMLRLCAFLQPDAELDT